jgi:hypothetical protein
MIALGRIGRDNRGMRLGQVRRWLGAHRLLHRYQPDQQPELEQMTRQRLILSAHRIFSAGSRRAER